MAYLDWKDEFRVGIEEMDSQYKRWIESINELHDAMKCGQSKQRIRTDIAEISITDYASSS